MPRENSAAFNARTRRSAFFQPIAIFGLPALDPESVELQQKIQAQERYISESDYYILKAKGLIEENIEKSTAYHEHLSAKLKKIDERISELELKKGVLKSPALEKNSERIKNLRKMREENELERQETEDSIIASNQKLISTMHEIDRLKNELPHERQTLKELQEKLAETEDENQQSWSVPRNH